MFFRKKQAAEKSVTKNEVPVVQFPEWVHFDERDRIDKVITVKVKNHGILTNHQLGEVAAAYGIANGLDCAHPNLTNLPIDGTFSLVIYKTYEEWESIYKSKRIECAKEIIAIAGAEEVTKGWMK